MSKKKKFLVALPTFKGTKGFCCPTVLVIAKDKDDAIDCVYHLKGRNVNIGDIKQVNY